MASLTLDAGVLIAFDRYDFRSWKLLPRMARHNHELTVPTVAVAQAWRGARSANLARALRGCKIEPLDDDLARVAGELCGRAGTSDAVDAVVMASAARRGDILVTTDSADLLTLAAQIKNAPPILDLNDL